MREIVRRNVAAQGAFILIVLLVIAARFALLDNASRSFQISITASMLSGLAACGLWLFVYFLVLKLDRSWRESIMIFQREIFVWERLVVALPALLFGILFIDSFMNFKASIATLQVYDFDPTFWSIDKAMHFGVDPWRITHALLGSPVTTWLIDKVYYVWFSPVFMAFAAAAFAPAGSALRHRFLIAFILVWAVLGIALATGLASGGPIYFDRMVSGPSPYAPLMETLYKTNEGWRLTTLQMREVLWYSFTGKAASAVAGISAMPSIHNAMCVLLFLAARHIDTRLAWAAAIFGIVIFIGSVHLGWHYAIDAYVSVLAVPLIWKFAGGVTQSNRLHEKPAVLAAPIN